MAANAGKVQKQARHLAVKQTSLQDMTTRGKVHYYLVKGTENHADHFTKILTLMGVMNHFLALNGSKFLDLIHLQAITLRNQLLTQE